MANNDARSLGELFTDLSREMSNLVRQEVALARTELTEKAITAGRGAALFIVAGVLAFFAVQVLLAAAVLGLALVLPAWEAALCVGGGLIVLAAIAGLLAWRGVRQVGNPMPQETVRTIKEDVQWARRQLT
jgi:uncharacterized membrane protein YqjE